MANSFLGEIKIMSFGFAPKGWALCNGQLMPITQNEGLFSLIGIDFGGNGSSNYALPNFQGKVPIHMGNGYDIGQTGGESAHNLSISELPVHGHTAQGTSINGSTSVPTTLACLGAVNNMYGNAANLTSLSQTAISLTGGSQPHPNMQPFLALTFCICLLGVFPSHN
jgi:microcystin-dependent protein